MSVMVLARCTGRDATGAWCAGRTEFEMETWVITDPAVEIIYGTVEAEGLGGAVWAADNNKASWFWSEPHKQTPLRVYLPFTLADGKWREAMPCWPVSAGDIGGDYQTGEALGRRWWMARPDGLWALFNVCWYVTDDTGWLSWPAGPLLERQEEFVICSDIHEPGNTERWSDYRYVTEEGWAAEQASVELAARDFDPDAEITWDGEEFS